MSHIYVTAHLGCRWRKSHQTMVQKMITHHSLILISDSRVSIDTRRFLRPPTLPHIEIFICDDCSGATGDWQRWHSISRITIIWLLTVRTSLHRDVRGLFGVAKLHRWHSLPTGLTIGMAATASGDWVTWANNYQWWCGFSYTLLGSTYRAKITSISRVGKSSFFLVLNISIPIYWLFWCNS